MCGAGDVTAPRKRHDWDQRQPRQFFGFRPRTTTRLAPQASHVRTSMDCWPAHAIGAGATAVDGYPCAARTVWALPMNCV